MSTDIYEPWQNVDNGNVTTPPHKIIYLQWEGDSQGEVTWCPDKINDDDVEYIRADAAEARIAELERVLRMVEFSGDYPYDPCLWCNGYAKNGHAPDCPRQKVLGEKLVEGEVIHYLEDIMTDPRYSSVRLNILCNSNAHYNVHLTSGSETILSGTGYTTLDQAMTDMEAKAKSLIEGE